ncbi:unnamed protein product [Rhizoctonia solani]|uniref:Uncharacterized protein n=1 Tax=Rhizoctonia solani TaxID=456999 RepID=A0A8H3GSU0_9AGAM|nr:unnamed protein product [Rhizoctonia solani]
MHALTLSILCSVIGASFGWETVEDAARLSRELVKRESVATLATVYPSDYRVSGLAGEFKGIFGYPSIMRTANLTGYGLFHPGHPFALMEHYASCHKNGSPSYLLFPISQNARNVASAPGNTASFTIRAAESPSGFEPDVGGSMGMDPALMTGDDGQVLLNGRSDQVPLSGKKNPVTNGWRGWGKSIFGGWQAKATERAPVAAARVALTGNVTVFYGVTGEGDTEGASLSSLRSYTTVLRRLISRGFSHEPGIRNVCFMVYLSDIIANGCGFAGMFPFACIMPIARRVRWQSAFWLDIPMQGGRYPGVLVRLMWRGGRDSIRRLYSMWEALGTNTTSVGYR